MTKPFFYIRHGQTDANAAGLFCGSGWDVPLNDAGFAQAHTARAAVSTVADRIQAICYSPMLRARQTKDILASALPRAQQVEVADLREWDVGEWCRKKYESVLPPGKDLFDCDPPGGESRAAFSDRVMGALAFCQAQGSGLLIVAHGAVGGVIARRLGIVTRMANATLYNIEPGSPARLVSIVPPADNTALPETITPRAANGC